jgi:hypothetical protein
MILCQEPWYNEPGREFTKQPEQSQEFNQMIQGWTVNIAIKDWLSQRKHRIWSEVLDRHFRASADAIILTAERWAREQQEAKKRDRLAIFRPPPWSVDVLRKAVQDYMEGRDTVPSMPAAWIERMEPKEIAWDAALVDTADADEFSNANMSD